MKKAVIISIYVLVQQACTHRYTHAHSLSRTHTRSLSLSRSLSRTHGDTRSLSLSRTHTLSLTLSLTHSQGHAEALRHRIACHGQPVAHSHPMPARRQGRWRMANQTRRQFPQNLRGDISPRKIPIDNEFPPLPLPHDGNGVA